MILRARGVKLPSDTRAQGRSEVKKVNVRRLTVVSAYNCFHKILIVLATSVVVFLWFSFFLSFRRDDDVRLEKNGMIRSPRFDEPSVIVQINAIRNEFKSRYGKHAAELYERGIISLGEDDSKSGRKQIAHLILSHLRTLKPILLSFGGYSVTVGRGNYFNQAFPAILHKVLKPLFESLHIPFEVRNAAIGGIPSFPYGWCLPNFLGAHASTVGWDYAMNEQKSAQGLESYIRLATSVLKDKPIMIVLDTNKKNKKDLLREYINRGVLRHAILLNGDDYVPREWMEEDKLPEGLQDWTTWGAPKGAPGQSPWHPKYKRHELMGWVLAMHVLEGVEEAIQIIKAQGMADFIEMEEVYDGLPPPITKLEDTSLNSLFFGVPDKDTWRMNYISCRTSFLPHTIGHLKDIVVKGIAENQLDILEVRPDELYAKGWVTDIGTTERSTKMKVMKYGGLGYVDMKEALYAIPGSGVLEMLLPYEIPVNKKDKGRHSSENARDWFKSLVICEVSEKRTARECDMEKNLRILVGGVETHETKKIGETGAVYLGKKICLNVQIPERAVIQRNPQIGLSVQIEVIGDVTRKNGACTISHVVWEHSP